MGYRGDRMPEVQETPWNIGDVVAKLRDAAGWTLDDLAEHAGMNRNVISKLETGRTGEAKRKTLVKIAAAFGLTVRELEDQVPQTPVRFDATLPAMLRVRNQTDATDLLHNRRTPESSTPALAEVPVAHAPVPAPASRPPKRRSTEGDFLTDWDAAKGDLPAHKGKHRAVSSPPAPRSRRR